MVTERHDPREGAGDKLLGWTEGILGDPGADSGGEKKSTRTGIFLAKKSREEN